MTNQERQRNAPNKVIEPERKPEPRLRTVWDTAKRWAGPAIAAYLASRGGTQVKHDPNREGQRVHADAEAALTYDRKGYERHFTMRLDGDVDINLDQRNERDKALTRSVQAPKLIGRNRETDRRRELPMPKRASMEPER